VSRWIVATVLGWAACHAHSQTLCRFDSAAGLVFGGYESLSATPLDTLTNVRVTCERNGGPQNVTLTMGVGPGSNASSVNARRMRQLGGTDFLSYGLYRDVSRSSAWGNSEGINTVAQTISLPNKGTQSAIFVIYGRIPALQDVSAGVYSDNVEITLTP
jgi:spore coat protein U-like protein